MKEMASGGPLDMQREKRWPNRTGNISYPSAPQTGAGVKVRFDPWEEDSDYSDMEGIGGPIIDKTKDEDEIQAEMPA
jgi:hypothetical protein